MCSLHCGEIKTKSPAAMGAVGDSSRIVALRAITTLRRERERMRSFRCRGHAWRGGGGALGASSCR